MLSVSANFENVLKGSDPKGLALAHALCLLLKYMSLTSEGYRTKSGSPESDAQEF